MPRGDVKTFSDEIIVPVISFLTLLAGVLGVLNFLYDPIFSAESIVALAASIMAFPGGIHLWHFRHLGWLMTLSVFGVSELLVLTSHVTSSEILGPVYFFVFTLFYGVQAYYLLVRRDLFNYPDFHARARKMATVLDE